jgi:hypothetical protein
MAYKPRKDIKVSETYIQKLRDAGSKKAALEKYGSSSDPKMREALRRFYGASAPTALRDTSRTRERTLPKSSIPMAKPKGTPSRNMAPARGKTPYKPTPKSSTAKPSGNKGMSMKSVGSAAAKFNNAVEGAIVAAIPAGRMIKAGKGAAKTITIARNTKTLKTATGSKANLARTKIGKAKGLATKTEVKQAKAAVSKKRGM